MLRFFRTDTFRISGFTFQRTIRTYDDNHGYGEVIYVDNLNVRANQNAAFVISHENDEGYESEICSLFMDHIFSDNYATDSAPIVYSGSEMEIF